MRLTKKDYCGYDIKNRKSNTDYTCEEIFDVVQKLGKLEDLEEELGCPLEVVFKAIKNEKIYVEKAYNIEAGDVYDELNNYMGYSFKPVFTYCEEPDDYFTNYANRWCFTFEYDIDGNDYTWDNYLVKFSDYQKTWWLKEDKSE